MSISAVWPPHRGNTSTNLAYPVANPFSDYRSLGIVDSDALFAVSFPLVPNRRSCFPWIRRERLKAQENHQLRQRLVRARRANLRRTHRLGHAEEDHDALAAAARRERLVGAEAAIDVLPVIHHPHVARRCDSKVRLHLEAATNVAVGWGDLVSCLHAGRAVLRACAAELRDRTVRHREIGDPDVVVTIHDHRPGPGEAAARER